LADQEFSNVLATTSLTVPENQNGTVLLQWLKDNGASQQRKVQLQATSINKDYEYRVKFTVDEKSSENCKPIFQAAASENKTVEALLSEEGSHLRINEPQDLSPIPFHFQITEAVHHLGGIRSRVTFRFQPNARHRLALATRPDDESTPARIIIPRRFDAQFAERQVAGKGKTQ